MWERDYAMVKNGNCDYKLTVAYDPDPDGISLDEEIPSLLSEMINIAESYNCAMEAEIYEVSGQHRSWQNQSNVQSSFFKLDQLPATGRLVHPRGVRRDGQLAATHDCEGRIEPGSATSRE